MSNNSLLCPDCSQHHHPAAECCPPSDPIRTVLSRSNLHVLSLIEELGAVVTHLREALEACESKNTNAMRSDIEDAADCLSRIESECSRAAAALQKSLADL